MALATWWRGDAVPTLSLLSGFRVEASRDTHLIAHINQLAQHEVRQRKPISGRCQRLRVIHTVIEPDRPVDRDTGIKMQIQRRPTGDG